MTRSNPIRYFSGILAASLLLIVFLGACDVVFFGMARKDPAERVTTDGFIVTFDPNGGDGAPEQVSVVAPATTVTTWPSTPVRTNNVFTGWNTQPEGEGTPFTPASVVSSNITVYARWAAVPEGSWIVTFNPNDWGYPFSQVVAPNGKAAQPDNVPRQGHSFDGWYSESSLAASSLWNFDSPITGNITLFAKWSPIGYRVVYYPNGGSGTTASTSHAFDVAGRLAANAFTPPPNHIFRNWSANIDGSAPIYAGRQEVINLRDTEGDYNLYAQWLEVTAGKNVVVFDSQGGSPVVPQTLDAGAKPKEPEEPSREGYDFKGWHKAPNVPDEWNFENAVTQEVTILYAHWEADGASVNPPGSSHVVVFIANGGTPAPSHKIVSENETVDPPATMTQTGFTFGGWTEEDTLSGEATPYNFSTPVTANITLYAMWGDPYGSPPGSPFTITFDSGDGTPVVQSFYKNGTVNPPSSEPAGGTGQVFGGWETESGDRYYFDTVTESLKLRPRWISQTQQLSTHAWSRSIVGGTGIAEFNAVAVDSSGNVYAVGRQNGTVENNYGNGVRVQGPTLATYIPVLVKYNSNGVAQWARTISDGTSAVFLSVAVDSTGNVYVAGFQGDNDETYNYGDGVTATGYASAVNPVLVKYDSTGKALWARTTVSGTAGTGISVNLLRDSSGFHAVAVDSAGDVYVAGSKGTGIFNYGGNSEALTSPVENALLVKYNSDGVAQWAKAPLSSTSVSRFNAIAIDSTGSVYAAGYRYPLITRNAVLMRFNANGDSSWDRGITGSSLTSEFHAVAVASTGNNVYAAGSENVNSIVVRYNTSGDMQERGSPSVSGGTSEFNAVSVDSAGNVYTAGNQTGILLSYNYAGSVGSLSGSGAINTVIVKYNPSLTAQTAWIMEAGVGAASFNGVAVNQDNIYAVGYQNGTLAFNHGNDLLLVGAAAINPVVVKFLKE